MKLSLTQMPELKESILDLPEKEKDKLLIRLINKDQMLIKQLHYKLLENESDLMSRTAELKDRITESFKFVTQQVAKSSSIKKYDIVNIHLRQLSGMVNEHASITKDKVSELELRIAVLHSCFNQVPDIYYLDYPNKSADKHFDYVAARLNSLLGIYDKLHEDLQYDYREQLLELIDFITDSSVYPYIKSKNSSIFSHYD